MQNLPTNQKEQLTWVLTETARQLLHALKWPARAWHAYGLEVRRRQLIERRLEALTDPTLLNRMSLGYIPHPNCRPAWVAVDTAEEGADHSVRITRSIDGIFRAV